MLEAADGRPIPKSLPKELFDALVVNPYNEGAVAEAIAFALELPLEERWDFTEAMRLQALQNGSVTWANTVLTSLQTANMAPLAKKPKEGLPDKAALKFKPDQGGYKAIFLDFDCVLCENSKKPEDIMSKATKEIMAALDDRSDDLKVFVISSREKAFLDKQLSLFPNLTLIAENGFYIKRPEDKWTHSNHHAQTRWKQKVRPVMELFVHSTPRSRIEETSLSVLWHHGDCDERYGEFKAKELAHHLALSLGNLPCQISRGPKLVEVSSLQVTKGTVFLAACQEFEEETGNSFEAILCAGGSRADESMFIDSASLSMSMPAITVRVGEGDTHARYMVPDAAALRRFLRLIVQDDNGEVVVRPKSEQLQRHSPLTRGSLGATSCPSMVHMPPPQESFQSCREVPAFANSFNSFGSVPPDSSEAGDDPERSFSKGSVR